MKIRTEIIVDASRDDVWAIFNDAEKKTSWQSGLKSTAQKTGKPGQPGALAELVYDESKRNLVVEETILERRDPSFLAASYVSKWGTMLIVNHFECVDQDKTRWIGYSNFDFSGFMRLMAVFIQGSVRKQIDADMGRFKLLVETELSDK